MSKSETIVIRIPKDLYKKLGKISAEQGIYINEIIIKAVDLYCRIYAKKKQKLDELMKRKGK